LVHASDPNAIDSLASTSRWQASVVSSNISLTTRRSERAKTFQSSRRSSSPDTYSRCCANSAELPRNGER
jgi:hypothetical protein